MLFQKKVGFDQCCGLTMPGNGSLFERWGVGTCSWGREGGDSAAALSDHTAFTGLCGLAFIVRPQLFALRVK